MNNRLTAAKGNHQHWRSQCLWTNELILELYSMLIGVFVTGTIVYLIWLYLVYVLCQIVWFLFCHLQNECSASQSKNQQHIIFFV